MTRDEILAHLRKMMVEMFELQAEKITIDAHLMNDLDLDSIDAIDMAVRLQEMTGQRMEVSSLRSIRTVGDVVTLVEQHLAAAE